MWKTKDIGARTAKEAHHAYNCLTSGDPERIVTAREAIATYRQAEPAWRSLDVIDMVKRWINQDRNDRESKDIALLHRIRKDAWDPGDGLPRLEKWKYKGRMARALLYCGRFKRSHSRFERAARLIRNPTDWPGHEGDAYDILSARAEAQVYLGFPEQGRDVINGFPSAARNGWRVWALAFAFHQFGFKDRVRFGQASGPDDTMPGNASFYVQSNTLLASIQGDLKPIERLDSHLLVAANFGALFRLGDTSAKPRAIQAFNTFKSAAAPSSNASWSVVKESRGRFPIAKFPFDPGSVPRPATRTWRTAYFGHYLENLKVCGLPDFAMDDGENDDRDEHDDDSGE